MPVARHPVSVAALTQTVRVASVPSSHVYVRHIGAEPSEQDAPSVVRLPDPHPTESGRSVQSHWWPPRMLDPRWVDEHAGDFDVFHIQFGFDAVAPADLVALTEALRRNGKPFVHTVHDLRNPHHADRAEHDAQLDILLDAADAVITLTRGAATEIRSRWGRDAFVIPHPHVVDVGTMAAVAASRGRREAGDRARIGLHVKSLRANMNPLPLVRALAESAERQDIVLQIDGHPDVLDPTGARYAPELSELLHDLAERRLIDLRVHDYFTDAELWSYLASLDASVLPYRFGTHSGWLEACRDLGTAVIAPSCGYYAEQGPVRSYRNDDTGFDPESLIAAVGAVRDAPSEPGLTVAARVAQRGGIAAQHAALYAAVLR